MKKKTKMKNLKHVKNFNESTENLQYDINFSFSIEPLFDDEFGDQKVLNKIKWLKDEIKDRYKIGFKSLSKNWSNECRSIDGNTFLYDHFKNKLFIKGLAMGGLIYDNGSWAIPCDVRNRKK